MFTTLHHRLGRVFPQGLIVNGTLTVVPFVGPSRAAPTYQLYNHKTAQQVRISEIGSSGSVPVVHVENSLSDPLFIVDGQQIVGAKQNRILNTDVLVPAKSSLDLPVSCVEQGRWRRDTPQFAPGIAAPRKVRERKLARVNASMAAGGGYDAGQGQVWRDVAECLGDAKACSSTGALAAAYEAKSTDVHTVREKVRQGLPSQAIGFAVFIEGWFQGLEMFDRSSTLAELFNVVFDGYALDWLGWKAPPHTQPPMGLRYLDRVQDELLGPAWSGRGALGLGTDWRLSSRRAMASSLEWEGVVVHLQVFRGES